MNINSHILRLSGKAELPKEVREGFNYHVSCEGSITSSSLHDNEDGTWNKVYTFKPVKVDLLDPLGETLRLSDPRSMSQKFRAYLYKLHMDEGYTEPFPEVYEQAVYIAMSMAPRLLEEAIKKVNKK